MQRKTLTILDVLGNAIRNASVRIVLHGTTTAAVIFTDNNSGVALEGSTLTTDGRGECFFYAANGRYDAIVTRGGAVLDVIYDIRCLDVDDGLSVLRIKQGTNAKQGRATLVAGAVTVPNTSVTSSSQIFVQRQVDGGTVAASYSITRVGGTSFTITAKDGAGANQATDTSTIAYFITEPA